MDKRYPCSPRSTSLDAVADADIIIEAVFEEMDIRKVFTGARPARQTRRGACDETLISRRQRNRADNEAAAGSARQHFFSPRT